MQKIVIINLLNDLNDIPKGPTKKILYRELKKYYMKNLLIFSKAILKKKKLRIRDNYALKNFKQSTKEVKPNK